MIERDFEAGQGSEDEEDSLDSSVHGEQRHSQA